MKAELNASSWGLRCRGLYQASGFAVAMLLPGFVTGFAGAAEPGADAAALREAHKLSQESFRIKTPDDRQERFKCFRELLSRLAAAGPGVTGTNASEQTLLRVARQAGSGELIDELVREYAFPKDEAGFTPRIQRPVPLEARHVTEKYRPAWEALLLPTGRRDRFHAAAFHHHRCNSQDRRSPVACRIGSCVFGGQP